MKGQHAFSVDVEEGFQSSTFAKSYPPPTWETLPSRVEAQTEALLELLASYEQRATFFVLGWIATRHPTLLRRIADAGHELASHGMLHQLAYELGPERFRDDVRRSKATIEEVTGQSVVGHRAASFSITPRSLWAFDILAEEGYRYDASVYPVRHHRYGLPSSPLAPHRRGALIELPIATLKLGPLPLGVGGGAYMRFLPSAAWLAALELVAAKRPLTIYVHPWECDPRQSRLGGSAIARLRQYGGQESAVPKLKELFKRFRFSSYSELAAAFGG